MKILVTGANGQLGKDLIKELESRGQSALGIDREDGDIADLETVLRLVEERKPDAVIHCAAYTAVDRAESDREACFAANVTGSRNMALAADKAGIPILAISTDYVFDGEGECFFEVDDPTGPQNYYGETKLQGENAIREVTDRYFIVRTSWVFGEEGNNFVKTMHRLGLEKDSLQVVCEEVGSPTYTKDLCRLLADMIVTERYGTYHATNEGICSRYEFAVAILKRFGVSCPITPVPSSAFPTPAKRPHNSRLSKKSLDENGFQRLPSWEDALARFEN